MNPKIKAQWVAALRSGKIKQARGQLRKGDAMCCLGVLCNLHAQAHPEIAAEQKSDEQYMGAPAVLPRPVSQWAGLGREKSPAVWVGSSFAGLSYHNDMGCTFSEIADAIESQL